MTGRQRETERQDTARWKEVRRLKDDARRWKERKAVKIARARDLC